MPRLLLFDVFGTVVDWRGSIIRECEQLGRRKGIRADWARFADEWRNGYGPAMNLVRTGKLPWTKIDGLHRRILDELLVKFQIEGLSEREKRDLNFAWHRLDPWPDAYEGLARLKRKFTIATLSNGNVSLLVNMAKRAGLPWDAVLSAELFRHYKPDREAYLGAAAMLDVPPAETVMVAAHKSDLQAARAAGLKTAYVTRPLERGDAAKADVAREAWMDWYAKDFVDLAGQM